MDYAVLLDTGEVGESTFGRGPIEFIYGDDTVVPGLYKAISGLGKGDRRSFKIDPTEGYGVYEASEVRKVPRAGLPPEVTPEPDMNLQVQDPTGRYRLVTIKEVEEETLTVDFNHPYAGKTLTFDVLIRNVREVTDEELGGRMSRLHFLMQGKGSHLVLGRTSWAMKSHPTTPKRSTERFALALAPQKREH